MQAMTSPISVLKRDLYNTYLSFVFEMKKHLKRRRLLIVSAIAVLVPMLFYISIPDTANQFTTTSLNFISVLIAITAAMFAGDAISSEFENKTALLSFPTPQKRVSIMAGKYVAALVATFLIVLLFYGVMSLQIMQLYGSAAIPTELWQSVLLTVLYSTSAVSIVFIFSSLFKRSMSATILGFVTLMMILPVLSTVLTATDVEPWFIVTYSAGLISNVVGDGGFRFGPGQNFGSVFDPSLETGIAVMFSYMIIGFIGSMLIASKRNVE
jgi:ABC-type transport system involved in multi-copper enzyme maturation permease subunit